MAGINKVIIVGNLGRDPEMRYMPDGTAVATFSVATSDGWQDKETGERKEKTEWHRVVAFRRLAEICGEYLSKGRQVYVEGKLQTREWEDKEGVKRYTTEIVLQTMQMLGPREAGGGQPGGGYGRGAAQNGPSGPGAGRQTRPQQGAPQARGGYAPAPSDPFVDAVPPIPGPPGPDEDDIPF